MEQQAYTYILASQKNGTLYTGVTSNLVQRMIQHKTDTFVDSFSAKYNVTKLVWYIAGSDITAAIELEKKIKNRGRAWKIALIERENPEWRDLSEDFLDGPCNFVQGDKCGGQDDKRGGQDDKRVG